MSAIVWADIDRDVVTVQGDDAGAFLHSQLANDISSLAVGSSIHSLLLEPTGQVTALVRVTRHDDTMFTLDVESGLGQSLITRLQRFVLRSKVVMSLSDWKVRAFRGDNAVSAVGDGPGRAIPYWGGADAIDVIAETSALPIVGEETEVPHIDMYRVDAQWPRVGADILVGDIPATTGVIGVAVSFSKGCYPGQELVERMDSRGANAPVRVVAISRDDVGVGSRVQSEGADVGTVTSIGFTRALARVARGASVGVDLPPSHEY
jgi:tRNA-modifying protein YgfZ